MRQGGGVTMNTLALSTSRGLLFLFSGAFFIESRSHSAVLNHITAHWRTRVSLLASHAEDIRYDTSLAPPPPPRLRLVGV